jgi:hypothetical protein
LLLIAALLLISGFGNFFVYTKQSKMLSDSSEKPEKELDLNTSELEMSDSIKL